MVDATILIGLLTISTVIEDAGIRVSKDRYVTTSNRTI